MSEPSPASPFSPPRAGRTAGFWRAWFGWCRSYPRLSYFLVTPLEKIATGWMLLPVFCVPLLGVYAAGRPLLRRLGPPLFGVAAIFALACVGQTGAGIALGLMAAIHAVGIAEYLDERIPADSSRRRILRRSGLALACAFLALSLGPSATRWLVVPVGTAQGVALFNPLDRTSPFSPQTMIAFHLAGYQWGGFRIDAAVLPGRVIASPGDKVEFASDVVTVNGIRRPALPMMPSEGTVHIPPGHTLVWPVDLQSTWRRGAGVLDPKPFVVADSALVGRSYKRWFWRTFTP